jgi:hypothetical protein
MLETPSIRRYFLSHPTHRVEEMGSENPSGAVNQQERPGFEQWVVGFVDGEGCFSIAVVRNNGCRLGWQVQHEFSVTQAAPSRSALEELIGFFGCGSIIESNRSDNHRYPLMRYSVKARAPLVERIIPFFEEHPLITSKKADFQAFKIVISMMESGAHLTQVGLREIAGITETMNRRQRSRYLESSEAIRQPPSVRRLR